MVTAMVSPMAGEAEDDGTEDAHLGIADDEFHGLPPGGAQAQGAVEFGRATARTSRMMAVMMGVTMMARTTEAEKMLKPEAGLAKRKPMRGMLPRVWLRKGWR